MNGLLLISGCTAGEEGDPVTEERYNPEEIAPFVEPDFPFITTSVDARELGPGFPGDNITPRCLALRLGSEAYACFDTDMLRWSVAWTGEFLPMVTMAQISYRDFHNKDNLIPTISGEPAIATGLYPGWMGSGARFADPRPPAPNPDGPSWGPLPAEIGRWNGVYLEGEDVVLSYTARQTEIHEKPGSMEVDEEVAFTRTFQIGAGREPLVLAAAEVTGGVRSEVSGNRAFLFHGEDEAVVTAVGLAGDAEEAGLEVIDNRYAVVNIPSGGEELNVTLVLWKGDAEQLPLFEQMLSEAENRFGMPEFRDGGPARWTETVPARGAVAPDTAAYVIDRVTLPVPNPWNRNVRAADVAFFEDNRAALVTFEGDVWIVDGIDRSLDNLEWRRYASGLYEPQSIEVVRDTVYVFGKEGIVRLHDLNGDGSADYYENFSNLMEQSIETREWAGDMVAAPDGSFYVSKFGALDMGPQTDSPLQIMGFRSGSRYAGSIVRVSPDGRSVEHYATGFRGPYLGIHPETGRLSASDQQGHSMPSTPVMLVEEGDYYGVPATAHRSPLPEITPPLTWIPHNVDQSGSGQTWITGGRMGPLNGHMVHFSYGRPGLFKVLIDSTSDAVQGGVSLIPGNYPAPTMRGAVGPVDGQLYFTGFSLWGSNSPVVSAFSRLRYTGSPSPLPGEFSVGDGGIVIRFGMELEEESAADPANFQVRRWNYLRTEEYGSGHYRLDGTPGEELLPVFSSHLSDDGHAVYLAVPDIREVQQMQLSYRLESAEGADISDDFWFTVNDVEPLDLAAEGFPDMDPDELLRQSGVAMASGEEAAPASAERGEALFQRTGCIACHSVEGASQGRIGPPVHGLANATRTLQDGTTTVADRDYLRRSILAPAEQVVEGYEAEMPPFTGILSDNEIESIILYIESLESESE